MAPMMRQTSAKVSSNVSDMIFFLSAPEEGTQRCLSPPLWTVTLLAMSDGPVACRATIMA
jgi:hypothetical protein